MLTMGRVPTVISLHQDDDTVDKLLTVKPLEPKKGSISATCAKGGPNFAAFGFSVREEVPKQMRKTRSFGEVGDACVPEMGNGDSSPGSADDSSESSDGAFSSKSLFDKSLFDNTLLSQWEDRNRRGLFRYDVNDCETRVLAGDLAFVAQLNEGRASKKRPTEFSVDLVCQEFDGSKFNFTKADESEVLFAFVPSTRKRAEFKDLSKTGSCPSLVLINVSPIEYGHVLLVPRVTACLPQRIRGDVLNLAVHMAMESENPYYRIGYNSLGAYATINHLHFQAYYLAAPFPIERASTAPVQSAGAKRARVHVQRTVNYPVRALVFEMGANVDDLTETVAHACMRMQEHNVPFNLLICDKGARIFLIPNIFSENMAKGLVPEEVMKTEVNPACFEISGHLLFKAREDYSTATQETAWNLLEQASLPEDRFLDLIKLLSA